MKEIILLKLTAAGKQMGKNSLLATEAIIVENLTA